MYVQQPAVVHLVGIKEGGGPLAIKSSRLGIATDPRKRTRFGITASKVSATDANILLWWVRLECPTQIYQCL